jgi:GntR family transcriptional regulator, transcriptional repressor for pyruvate dehydrogenase complex
MKAEPTDTVERVAGVIADTPTALEPVRLPSAGEHIAERVVTAIALGEFVPGQRLPSERDLAAMLGVSRTTVREAIQRLAAAGHVDVRRGRTGGAYVKEAWTPGSAEMIRRTLLPRWDSFEALFDLRELLEPLIARTAAERRSEEDVRTMSAALDAYRAASDREQSRAADQALHVAVARAAHNPYLVALSARVRREISLGFGAEPYSAEIRARAIQTHAALVRAIAARQPARAARVAGDHFRLTEDRLRELRALIAGNGEVKR